MKINEPTQANETAGTIVVAKPNMIALSSVQQIAYMQSGQNSRVYSYKFPELWLGASIYENIIWFNNNTLFTTISSPINGKNLYGNMSGSMWVKFNDTQFNGTNWGYFGRDESIFITKQNNTDNNWNNNGFEIKVGFDEGAQKVEVKAYLNYMLLNALTTTLNFRNGWNTTDTNKCNIPYDTKWHHIAFSFNQTTLNLFIDGVKITKIVPSNLGYINWNNFIYGGYNHWPTHSFGRRQYFQGHLSDARLWNTYKTDELLISLYANIADQYIGDQKVFADKLKLTNHSGVNANRELYVIPENIDGIKRISGNISHASKLNTSNYVLNTSNVISQRINNINSFDGNYNSLSNKPWTNNTNYISYFGKLVINNGENGTNKRGIMFWTANDTNWGIYMGTSGTGKSFNNTNACDGKNFTVHTIRIRTADSATQGFIYENSSDTCLFSIRGSDGMTYYKGHVGIDVVNPSYALDVSGDVNCTGIYRV